MKSARGYNVALPTTPSIYTTQSAFCAAWIMYRGHEVVEFRMIAPPKGEFVFDLTPELQESLKAYFDGTAEVNLRTFVRQYNSAKDIIWKFRRGPEATATVKRETE